LAIAWPDVGEIQLSPKDQQAQAWCDVMKFI